MRGRLAQFFGPALAVAIFAVALLALRHELRHYHYHDIARGLLALPPGRVLAAIGLTALGYLVLTGYDALALRYIRHPLPYRRIAFASFVGYSFSQNLGFPWLTGGSVRLRLYSSWGLSAIAVTNLVAFCGVTFWLGVLTIGGLAFLLQPQGITSLMRLSVGEARLIGALLVALVLGYIALSAFWRKRIVLRDWQFRMPPPSLALGQVVISSIDWSLAAAVLYTLLLPAHGLSYPTFLGIFLLAQISGLISHVPGGLGVFETVLIFLLTSRMPASQVLGGLVAFRAIYYLLPLIVGAVMMATHEALRQREGVIRVAKFFGRWVPGMAPHVLSFTTFLGGAILLFSGATPAVRERLRLLRDILPLPIVEISHFVGSLAGAGLVVLAAGLQRRLDAAYLLTVALLTAGIFASLLKGLDYEEAIVLTVLLGVLLPSRRYFYRKASLLSERFTPGWIVAIAMVVGASLWLAFFSFRHVEYSNELWWHFAFRADAPRSLRASVGVLVTVLLVAIAHLLRPARREPAMPTEEDLARARAIVARSPDTVANLALLGDKSLLFSDSGNAFIMYGVEGRSWVALGDPVGPEQEAAELAWSFRELVDEHGGWTVFYEVSREHLPLYLDLGLTLLKIGERARVPLSTFSLEGKARKSLRQGHQRLLRSGLSCELIPAERVADVLPELQAVSDAWLAEKRTREKGFSLGTFTPSYIRQFPAAVARRDGRIIAFANVWLGAKCEELSVDLMRYLPAYSHGVMDFLFIEVMLWGRAQGYRWFDLGMAPLSGLKNRSLAPLWSRIGALIFRQGENFYNFQGLRAYKEKFDPVWEPRYLASPGGIALPRILTNVATLIAGGLKGIIAK